jgi:putative transposase
MSIDLGIDNLATIVTNTGLNPVLVKGKHVKSINAYYNKLKGHYLSVLRQGKGEKEGPFTSKRLEKIHEKRHLKIKDIFHKVSFHIVTLAESEQVDTIIIGHNKNWKQSSNMGRRNNQNFCSIPHSLLIEMIQYKAKQRGIKVEVIEESYTSKASFLDDDFIPTYVANSNANYKFFGVREKRGLYIAATGEKISADVNGSANIMKKYVLNHLKEAFFHISSVCVKQPNSLQV